MTPAEKLRARLAAHVNKVEPSVSRSSASSNPSTAGGNAPAERVVPALGNDTSTEAPTVPVITEVQSTDLALVERPELDSSDTGPATGTDTDLDLSNPVHAEFISRLNKLDAALTARDPSMPLHLLEIHKALITYDEITPLLRPEEIGRIMAAQQQHVAVVLRQEVTGKAKSSATRAAAKVTLNDI